MSILPSARTSTTCGWGSTGPTFSVFRKGSVVIAEEHAGRHFRMLPRPPTGAQVIRSGIPIDLPIVGVVAVVVIIDAHAEDARRGAVHLAAGTPVGLPLPAGQRRQRVEGQAKRVGPVRALDATAAHVLF